MKTENSGIVGKWFHSIVDNAIEKQGQVLTTSNDKTYLVQYYSWITTEPTTQKIIDIADMKAWNFYDTNKEMNAAYDRQCELDMASKYTEQTVELLKG
jgi:hypothetical protein